MAVVYVSVGSNVDREDNLRSALAMLRQHFGRLALSPIYESEAYGFKGSPFYNLVVKFSADDFDSVRSVLKAIEDGHCRDRSAPKFSDRTLDLDILLFGDADFHYKDIDIPRDEITRFAFILRPLAELAPKLKHPTLGLTYQQLWQHWQVENNPAVLDLVVLDEKRIPV